MRPIGPWLAVALLIGCGDDGGESGPADGGADAMADGDVDAGWVPANHIEDPTLITGGGASSGPIDGELNVFVIDGATNEPIEDAEVMVGEPDAADPLEGLTDADGLVVFQDPSLSGPQVVTAWADNHAASTWFGVNGAVVTITLDSLGEPVVPTATISGSIPDWPPTFVNGQSAYAYIWYSATADLFGPENEIDQGGGFPPPNMCFYLPSFPTPCTWSLTTRTGKLAVYAIVVEVDNNGTPGDESDDIPYILSYAVQGGYDLAEDDEVTDQELTLIAQGDLITADVIYDTLPGDLTDTALMALLQLGDDGAVVLAGEEGIADLKIPALTGSLASASYDVWGMASNVDGAESVIVARDVDVTMQVDLGAWLDLPANLGATDGDYSFDPPTGALLHIVEFQENLGAGSEEPRWNVVIFDGTVPFTLPDISADPFSGDMQMNVNSAEVSALDPGDFTVDSLFEILERLSGDSLQFTP